MIDKTYEPGAFEREIYATWEKRGAFRSLRPERKDAQPYAIMLPPPNVTGSLHVGHALDDTLQDILIRTMRLRGRDVLWQPGTDHAGIATQLMVERDLASKGEPDRRALGREAFLERVWKFKEESGSKIIDQLKRLGCSCDWERARFTLDEGLSSAVTEVFVRLYEKGLLYRDRRLVNWDCSLRTALSDLEVHHKDVVGNLYELFYPLEGEPSRGLVVATTRPETMLGDVAVAVNPEDQRYHDLIGRSLILPLVGRPVPVIADVHADPAYGSGAVKITPAHDFNDFDVGKRHGLPMISIFDEEGALSLEDNPDFFEGVPDSPELEATRAMHGMDRFAAREVVLERLAASGSLRGSTEVTHALPYDEKSKSVVLEPRLTLQWYVAADRLAEEAIAAVRDKRTRIVPETWEKVYFDWMENIEPWCISRQLWWGHRIPAWYGPDDQVFVARDLASAQALALEHYGEAVQLRQDEDVLDTWFSSGLWPFSTLGWPETTQALERYYPTSVLVTGFDILFFWVARMMMSGLAFMGEVPFSTVYLHGLVRDDKGQKMSKTRGNVIDPLALIDQYGADALRFSLAALNTNGRDIRLSAARVEGDRNFATKLWNATRFALMNGVSLRAHEPPQIDAHNLWVYAEWIAMREAVEKAVDDFRFNDLAEAHFRFVRGRLCDWYVEFAKVVLRSDDKMEKIRLRNALGWIIRQTLILLHPVMPFVTEEIWRLGKASETGELVAQATWPAPPHQDQARERAHEQVERLIQVIARIRSLRSALNVPDKVWLKLDLCGADAQGFVSGTFGNFLQQLARVEAPRCIAALPPDALHFAQGETLAFGLHLAKSVDLAAQCNRLHAERKALAQEIERLRTRLDDKAFCERAPGEIVDKHRLRLKEKIGEARDRDHLLGLLQRPSANP